VIVYQVDLPGLPIIRSIDVATGRAMKIIGDAGLPHVPPDGTQIAFNTWSMVRVTLANIDGSERRVISSPGDRCCAKWSPDGERLAFRVTEATHASMTSRSPRRGASNPATSWTGSTTRRSWCRSSDH
jgi:Tol biopolymer transport system component